MNGFALRLALKLRPKGTWKWPIACHVYETFSLHARFLRGALFDTLINEGMY